MYGLEACSLIKSQLLSLDFAVNRFFMKVFRTSSTEIVKQCQEYFAFEIPSLLWSKRVNKFENKLKNTDNLFYKKIVVIYLLILLIVMLSCHPYKLSCLYITY